MWIVKKYTQDIFVCNCQAMIINKAIIYRLANPTPDERPILQPANPTTQQRASVILIIILVFCFGRRYKD